MARQLPVYIQNNQDNFDKILLQEGELRTGTSWTPLGDNPRPAVVAGSTLVNGSISPNVGKTLVVHSIRVTTDRPINLGLTIKTGSHIATGLSFFLVLDGKSGEIMGKLGIDLPILIRDGGVMSWAVANTLTGDRAEMSIVVIGYEITNDFNFRAAKTLLICGDSTTWGTMGNDATSTPYLGEWLYVNQLRDKLRDAGASLRVSNQGFGGSDSRDWARAINNGKIDAIPYNALIVSLGPNDAANISGSYTIADFKANLKKFVEHRNRLNRGAIILFLAPGVTDKTTMVGNIAAIRTAVQEVVSESIASGAGTAQNILFYNLENSFSLNATASADVNFNNTERSAGNRVHRSGLGHTLDANAIWAAHGTALTNALK